MAQKPLGYKQSAAATAKGITDIIAAALVSGGAVLPAVDFVYVQCETQNCRWRDDGTAPTAAVGHLLATGGTLVLSRGQFNTFQIIEVAASTVINCTAYKTG